MGFSRQEYYSVLPCTPPGDLPGPGIEPRSPALQVDSLPSEPPGKPPIHCTTREVLTVCFKINLKFMAKSALTRFSSLFFGKSTVVIIQQRSRGLSCQSWRKVGVCQMLKHNECLQQIRIFYVCHQFFLKKNSPFLPFALRGTYVSSNNCSVSRNNGLISENVIFYPNDKHFY